MRRPPRRDRAPRPDRVPRRARWSPPVPETAVVPVPHQASDHGPFPRGGGDPERPTWEDGPIEPLYDRDDAAATMLQFRGIDYDTTIDVAAGVRATFHDAGHILGSAIIVVEVTEAAGDPRRLVFSGDLGRSDAPILRDPTTIVDGADYVLVESTYGGREHEPEDEAVRLLAEAVHATADHSRACCSSRPSPSAGPRTCCGSSTGCSRPAASRTCRSTWTRRWRPARRPSTSTTRSTTTPRRAASSRRGNGRWSIPARSSPRPPRSPRASAMRPGR